MKRQIIAALTVVAALFAACDKDDKLPDISTPGTEGSTPEQKITLNIVDFGGDNTGVKDCSDAFAKLIEAMGTNRYVEVYLPAGRYKISKRITFDKTNFAGYDHNGGLMFRGAGEDATELVCDNAQGGFCFNVGTNMITVTIENMSFVAPRINAGTAIEFNTSGQNAGDHHSRMLSVRNVLIRGENPNTGYFTNGVMCYNAWYPILENVKVTSLYGANASSSKMNCGFMFQNCYSPLVTNCYVWNGAVYGLLYKTVDGFLPEDGIIENCYFVGQDYGVDVNIAGPETAPWPEPAFHLTNTHIHYRITGFRVRGMRQVFVSGNLFYCFNSKGSRWWNSQETPEEFESRDIFCDYAWDMQITNNQFTEPASPRRIGIDISENSANILITNNIFNFDGAAAIRNLSPKTSYASGNVFGGEPDFTRAEGGAGEVVLTPYDDQTGTLRRVDYE